MTSPWTGMPCSESFQPIRRASASMPGSVCATSVNVPRQAIAGRDGVPALRLRADDGLVDAARAALEHLAVLVDEEVVADVVPAVGVAVVARDAEHDRGGVLRAVVVGRDRVVDEGELYLAVAGGRARGHGVAAPFGARDDHGRPGLGGARAAGRAPAAATPRRAPARRATAAVGRVRTKRTRRPRALPRSRSWKLVGGARPRRLGAGGRARRRRARGRRAGAAAPSASSRRRAGGRAAATSTARAARPAHADQVEAARRAQDPGRAPAAGGRRARRPASARSSSNSEVGSASGAGRERSAPAGERGGAQPERLATGVARREHATGTRPWCRKDRLRRASGASSATAPSVARAQSGQAPRSTTSCAPTS